jgi:hypothetical protein
LVIGVTSMAIWSNRPYLRGNDQVVASTIPHFDGTLISAVNQGHVRSDLSQLRTTTGGHVFLAMLSASYYYLAANLQNPTPYDYPARSDLGTGGERAVITTLRHHHVRWVCIRPAALRSKNPIEPTRIENYVLHQYVLAKHLNLCDLYRTRTARTPLAPSPPDEANHPANAAGVA